MKLFQLFDEGETTWYVQASQAEHAVQWLEETFQVKVENWTLMNFMPLNVNTHVAYEKATHCSTV